MYKFSKWLPAALQEGKEQQSTQSANVPLLAAAEAVKLDLCTGRNGWVTAGSTPALQNSRGAAEERRWREGPAAAARRVPRNRRNSKKVNNSLTGRR